MTRQIKVTGLAAALAVVLAAPAAANDLRMMTGPQGGSWIPIGGQLKDLWEKAIPGTKIQVFPGAGIANVRGVEDGKAEVGLANSISTADAMTGREPFKKPHGNVCNIASLYPQYFQFVVLADAKINKISDLKGKSITTQQRGNTGEVMTRHFLEAHGLTFNDVKVSFVGYTDSVNQMKDGHAVAFGLNTQAPAGAVMDLQAAREIKIFEQADIYQNMLKLNPSYKLITLPKGTYPKQDKDLQVIGFQTHVVLSCKLPEQMVYTMTKTIAENTKTLGTVARDILTLTPKGMAADIGVRFHPGAARYYKEAGINVSTK
ncbi:MAG: TAXI family TRAP transporter solute-binding subunit [Alphaproteobacteria bacterium]|nr:TAXI family TRAP transporter solute-binding subunit [Alphaproteobacteria bacterium]